MFACHFTGMPPVKPRMRLFKMCSVRLLGCVQPVCGQERSGFVRVSQMQLEDAMTS
jgi:hypothetical protein